MERPQHARFLHGRALGAAIGAVVALAGALVVHVLVANDSSDLFSWPATLVTALFVGVMAGLLFSSIVIGGREDDRATHEAHEALARERAAASRRA
ncbi:MAG TPA: hypothetical protein VGK92_10735 [Gaiellales bacterium]|jgi:hypothetical protein